MSDSSLDADALLALTREVRATLLRGERYRVPGFGTFTTCTRRASGGKPSCTMAMWRADAALRDHLQGGPATDLSGPHCAVLASIIAAMNEGSGVDLPHLGQLGVVRAAGKKPKLTFHAAAELNAALTAE